ncbi:MAG: divalent-cation tolerance protein CutA [Gammaproteobacteria bacterium]|nr:divalent-cation tolerance protein CutA [Gammaproteobacteria bacterium]
MSAANTLLIFCTCPDQSTAGRLAGELVERRLAACVSQLPGLISTYRWQEKLAHDEEVLLMIKTTKARYADLEQTLAELHPYELPEILAVPVNAGLSGYLDWVAQSTR